MSIKELLAILVTRVQEVDGSEEANEFSAWVSIGEWSVGDLRRIAREAVIHSDTVGVDHAVALVLWAHEELGRSSC